MHVSVAPVIRLIRRTQRCVLCIFSAMSAYFFISRRAPPRRRMVDVIVLLVLLGTALVPAMLLYEKPRDTTITMDAPAVLLPRDGLYRYERLPSGSSRIYSWTDGSSTLKLPNPGGETIVRIELLGPTTRATPVQMRFDRLPFSLLAPPEPRVYSIALPAMPRERITLTIDSPQVNIHRRKLGIGISTIEIAGGGKAPAQVLFALALATIGFYVLLRQAGLPRLGAAGTILTFQALTMLWLAAGGWSYARLGTVLPLAGRAALATAALDRWRPGIHPSVGRRALPTRHDVIVIATLLLVALGVRLLYLAAPDPVGDLELSARRMGLLYANGLAGAYAGDGDYLPLRLYWLWGLSK